MTLFQVGCYCWLDKLGMAARYRVTTVVRQVTTVRYRETRPEWAPK